MVHINVVDASRIFGRESRAMTEGTKKRWIKGAIGSPGALHRHLGIPEGDKIPEARLREAARSKNPTIRKEANLAMTLKGFHRDDKEKKPARRSAKDVRRTLYGAS